MDLLPLKGTHNSHPVAWVTRTMTTYIVTHVESAPNMHLCLCACVDGEILLLSPGEVNHVTSVTSGENVLMHSLSSGEFELVILGTFSGP